MKITAPEYYKKFKCIADRCTHSCCIGWEIDVDEDTMEKYASLSGGYADVIRSSVECGETPHFRLCGGERCPHLDGRGLCKIITEYGDSYLCDICREHPRFYNETAHGLEVGLGMACEEACRIVLGSDDYDKTAVIEEDNGIDDDFCDFDVIPHRERIYRILKDASTHYADKLAEISRSYGVSLSTLSNVEWRGILSSLEYLDESHRESFSCYSSSVDPSAENEKGLERALAYFIYRHVSGAWDEGSLRARVGFALFCERLLASVITYTELDTVTAARIISEEIEYSEDNTQSLIDAFI
jgi:lysine-N-methylase